MIKELLEFIWKYNLKEDFLKGKLIYERQLQALLYYYLRANLDAIYNAWIEPTIYFTGGSHSDNTKLLEKTKPDIIITEDETRTVQAIIELKFKPWEEASWKEDISKLFSFQEESENKSRLLLGWKPIDSNWQKQKNQEELVYSLNPDAVFGFFVGARPDAEAVKVIDSQGQKIPKDLLHLVSFIEPHKGGVYFGEAKEKYVQKNT